MMIKFGLIFLSVALSGEQQEQLQKIEGQIQELEEMQEKLRSNAQKNVNNAMRWQFQNDQHSDARKAWERAAQEKEKIEEIDAYLKKLKGRRQAILQENGQ